MLLATLKDREADVRIQAARALEKIGTQKGETLLADGETLLAYVNALASLGKDAVPFLIPRLQDGNSDINVPLSAAKTLASLGPDAKDAVPALVQTIQRPLENNQKLREAAAGALSAIGPDAAEAVPTLIDMLKDGDPNLKELSLRVLSAIGPKAKSAVPLLLEDLKQGRSDHLRGLHTLLRIDPQALNFELLEKLIQHDSESEVQLVAAQELFKRGARPPVLIAKLVAMLKRELLEPTGSSSYCVEVSRLLGQIGPPARDAIPLLLAAMEHRSPAVRMEAYRALQRVDPAGAARIAAPQEGFPSTIQNPQDLRRYFVARRDAAQKSFEDLFREFLAGRGQLEPIIQWSRRWLEAETALHSTKEDRMPAFQAHRDRMMEIERINRLRFEAGRIPVLDMTAAEFTRLEAEIWLAEARMK